MDETMLTTDDRLIIAIALRDRAIKLRELATKPYGRKGYRAAQLERADNYSRLADAFSEHTKIILAR